MKKQILLCGYYITLLLLGISVKPANAGLTDGWTEVPYQFIMQTPYDLPMWDRYGYDPATKTHSFWVRKGDKYHFPGSQASGPRSEMRTIGYNYRTVGKHQFEADFCVLPGTDATCIFQIKGGEGGNPGTSKGTFIMLRIYGDYLCDGQTEKLKIVKSPDKWYHLNVIDDAENGDIYVYVDDKLIITKTGSPADDDHYFKCGVYNQSGAAELNQSKFRNIKLWEYYAPGKKMQTVTFPKIPSYLTVGDPDYQLSASSSSGLPIRYLTCYEPIVTFVNGKIHIEGDGYADINASQPGNSEYNMAEAIMQYIIIRSPSKQNQTISCAAEFRKKLGDPDFSTGATASSGSFLKVYSSNRSVATVTHNNVIHIEGTGTTTLTFLQIGNDSYNGAVIYRTLTVDSIGKLDQTINFAPLPAKITGDADFNPGATATSGLTVSYSSSNTSVATIVNGNIHIAGVGTTVITASQAGNANFNPAPDLSQPFTVTDKPTILPYPWVSGDVGNPALSGSASHSGGVFTLKGAGADVWGTTDQFQFVHQSFGGDGEIIARVNSVTNTNTNAKAGIMIRQNLNGNSAFAYITQRPDNQVQFDARTSAGATAFHVSVLSGTNSGIKYLRLTRYGNTFTGYYSTTGTSGSWVQLGTTNIAMADSVHIGLFVTSHNTAALCTGVLNEVSVLTNPKLDQTIAFATLPDRLVTDADFNAGATASSRLPVSYTSSNTSVATIVNGNIHIIGAGTSTITASQAGNQTYNPAADVTQVLTVLPITNWYKIKVVNNPTFVLNAASATPVNGTNVNMYTSNTSNAQLWQMVDVGSGYVKIVPYINTNFCLDCSTTPANGINVQLWTYSGNTRQQWLVTDLGNGYKKITVRANAAFGLDCSTTPANNVNVQVWTYSGNNRQQWILEPVTKSAQVNQVAKPALTLNCSPNPVQDLGTITYSIPEAGTTKLLLLNAQGQLVRERAAKHQEPGEYTLTFQSENLMKGLYFIKLISAGSEITSKVLIK